MKIRFVKPPEWTEPETWGEILRGIPVPSKLRARMVRLREFIASPGFRNDRRIWMRDYALEELAAIRLEAYWEVYRVLCARRDQAGFDASKRWVKADAAETTAELYETLSMSIPRRPKETMARYIRRIKDVRASLLKNAEGF